MHSEIRNYVEIGVLIDNQIYIRADEMADFYEMPLPTMESILKEIKSDQLISGSQMKFIEQDGLTVIQEVYTVQDFLDIGILYLNSGKAEILRNNIFYDYCDQVKNHEESIKTLNIKMALSQSGEYGKDQIKYHQDSIRDLNIKIAKLHCGEYYEDWLEEWEKM